MQKNPILVPCGNKGCAAVGGVPCTTVGGFVSASPHTSRARAVLGKTASSEEWTTATRDYCAAVLELLLKRPAESHEVDRALRDGSLKPTKGWLAALIDESAPQQLRLPTKRTDQFGTVTLWGIVTREVELPSGGFILELDSGELVRLSKRAGWAKWWPERKRDAAQFLAGRTPRYRFEIPRNGECSSVDFEAAPPTARKTPAAAAPAIAADPIQGTLL